MIASHGIVTFDLSLYFLIAHAEMFSQETVGIQVPSNPTGSGVPSPVGLWKPWNRFLVRGNSYLYRVVKEPLHPSGMAEKSL